MKAVIVEVGSPPPLGVGVFTLTAREHFIAHWLLVKMCANEEHKKKMLFALYLMTYGNNRDDKATCGTIYERIRQAYNDSIQGENHPRFGKKHSAETRAKLSANMTGENSHYWGKNLTEATKKKLSLNRMGEKNHMFGKKHSAEKIAKMSGENNVMFGKVGSLHPSFGRKHTEEWKDDIRNRFSGENNPRFGVKHTDEAKAKISKGMRGSDNHGAKKVKHQLSDTIFDTVKDAAIYAGLPEGSGISKCCKGKQQYSGKHPLTGEKLIWSYV